MAKICVEGYSMIPVMGGSFSGHMYLVYTDDDGLEWVCRAAKGDNDEIVVEANVGLSFSSDKRVASDGSLLSPADRGAVEIDLNGRDAASVWKLIVDYAADVYAESISYNVLGPNSNSFVGRVLDLVGIDVSHFLPEIPNQVVEFIGWGSPIEFDYSISDSGDSDVINGNDKNQVIILSQGYDIISTRGGDDVVYAGSDGGDVVDGGDSNLGDIAIFNGGIHSYIFAGVPGGVAISSVQLGYSQSQFYNVEFFKFGNILYSLGELVDGWSDEISFMSDAGHPLSGVVISEESVVGTRIAIADIGGDGWIWSLLDDGGVFRIDPATGEVFVDGPLDFETNSSVQLTVRAQNGNAAGGYVDRDLTINLQDVNEAPISFDVSKPAFGSHVPAGTVVAVLSGVMDQDVLDVAHFVSGAAERFRIVEDIKDRFEIVGNEIRTKTSIPLTDTSYQVKVVAVDAAGLISASQIISLMPIQNTAPTGLIWENYDDTIAENSPAGTLVGRIVAQDADAGDTFTYHATGAGDSRFTIDAQTGDVFLKPGVSLDFEANNHFYLDVTVTDSAGNSSEIQTRINIGNVNEAPTSFGNNYTRPSNTHSIVRVFQLTDVVDVDGGMNVLELVEEGTDPTIFNYLKVSNADRGGYVDSWVSLDGVAPAGTFQVAYRTVDIVDGVRSHVQYQQIEIMQNSAPTGVQWHVFAPRQGEVRENSANGTLVGAVIPIDPDAYITGVGTGEVFTWHGIVGEYADRFVMDASGYITVKNGYLLDFEQQSQYLIHVDVGDAAGHRVVAPLTIQIDNVDGIVWSAPPQSQSTPTSRMLKQGTPEDDILQSFQVPYLAWKPLDLRGGRGDDLLIGGNAADDLWGEQGNDIIYGGGGRDRVFLNGQIEDFTFFDAGSGFIGVEHIASGEVDKVYEDVETFMFNGPWFPYAHGAYSKSTVWDMID